VGGGSKREMSPPLYKSKHNPIPVWIRISGMIKMKCLVHGIEMKEVVSGCYTKDLNKGEHIGWYCPKCKKQYSDGYMVIAIVCDKGNKLW
jgi:hypothetical protein